MPTVKSVSDFIDIVLRQRNAWEAEDRERSTKREESFEPLQLWFRGQENARWRLVPKLYRLRDFNENEIRSEFKLRAFQLMTESHIPKDDREWYFLMQHFGAPTRLLDWTDSALIALYFALKLARTYKNASVWILDPTWLNEIVLSTLDENNYISGVMLPHWKEAKPWFPEPFEEPLHVMLPIAIDPPHIARRVSVQRSRFTVHGRSERGLDVLLQNKPKHRLVKLTIPNAVAREMLRDLSTCGVVETSVFPDLEGLSRELTTKWAQIRPMELNSSIAPDESSRKSKRNTK
jgi:hypothetical protein